MNIKTIPLLIAVLLFAAFPGTAADQSAPEKKRDLLSRHETVARFEGVKEHRCFGRTSLCPDRCGHSGTLATFKIVKYTAYEKPGKYGDPRQSQFSFLIQDNMKNLKVSSEINKTFESLKAGDYVVLNWRHDYITSGGAKYPERPIQKLVKITKEEADKAPSAAEAPDEPKK